MMHQLLRNILLIIVGFLGIQCSEKQEPQPLTFTQLIAGTESKTWRFQSIEIIDEGEESGPIPAQSVFNNPCSIDDEYTFYNDEQRTYEFSGGNLKCSSNDPEVLLSDFWQYTTANATFTFALPLPLFGDIYRLPFTVKSLSADEMILEIYFNNIFQDGTDASYRLIFRPVDQ